MKCNQNLSNFTDNVYSPTSTNPWNLANSTKNIDGYEIAISQTKQAIKFMFFIPQNTFGRKVEFQFLDKNKKILANLYGKQQISLDSATISYSKITFTS